MPTTLGRVGQKRAAAQRAADLVCSGMVVGLGTGSTAIFALRRIGARLADGNLHDIVGIATSTLVQAAAGNLGIPVGDLARHPVIDLSIDRADEVDTDWNLIKGGGGALLREKIVAQASTREIIVIDASKLSPRLGTRHTLPVEVVEFGWRPEALYLESLGATVTRRLAGTGSCYRTDNHNFILDAAFGPIAEPAALSSILLARAGVVEVGLFCGLVSVLIVGTKHRCRAAGPLMARSESGPRRHRRPPTRGDPDRHRQRGGPVCGCLRAAGPRRHGRPGGGHALPRAVRAPRPRLPRCCPSLGGASAPIQQVQAKVGFEPAHVVATARAQLAQARTATT